MSKTVALALALMAISAIRPIAYAQEEFVFPVGVLFMDNVWKEGWPFDISDEGLVDLRSKGFKVTSLNGMYGVSHPGHAGRVDSLWVMEDVDTLKKKLARADSFGLLVYADIRTFEDALKRYGHSPETNADSVYFRWYNSQRYTASVFRDSLDKWVSWVVDPLNAYLQQNDIRSLYRYIFWDEPFSHHVRWVREATYWEDDYWENIWLHDDTLGLHTDSRGVYTLLKNKIEEKDTLHSVWLNLSGAKVHFDDSLNTARAVCQLRLDTIPDTIPNPPHQFSIDRTVFAYGTPIGDTSRIRDYWTSIIDSTVVPAKSINPSNPPPVYVTQLQSWGCGNVDSLHFKRITIPEEVKEIANLAILHEIKGIMHFILPSIVELRSGILQHEVFANLWDDDFVPWDAPYEEYVYNRHHSLFSDPETLQPFNPDDPIHDPFRTLPPEPVDSVSYHRYLEDYYAWKYAPYARIYNALGEVNNPLQIIGTELLDLWKTSSVATIEADSSNIFLPEIVTLSPTTTSDVCLFFVNKDMKHSKMGFTVRIMRSSVPQPLQSAYILDLSERHLIQRTVDMWHITFRDTLGAGEGRLVRLMTGTELGDAMIADPDIRFEVAGTAGPSAEPQHIFTEGDSVEVSATVYNLGFTPLDTVIVKFYDGHRDPSNLMRSDTISLSPLTSTTTSDSVASFVWSTSHDDIAPHNITVFVEEPLPSAANTGNNEANMALLVLPEDYATAVRGDPWDLTETGGGPGTADIDSFQGFVETPDSISGVWEARTTTDSARVFLHLADSIDGSKYNQFSVRLIQDPDSSGEGYLKLGWKDQTGTPSADSVLYDFGHWDVKNLDLSDHPGWKNSRILSLWIRPAPQKERLVKFSWVKLTTEKP